MAETQRSIATLQSLLADNAVGAISPQDVRDFMETVRLGQAELYISSTSATSFSDTTSFVQVAGTWTLSSGAYNWTEDVDGQLKYTGVADRSVIVICPVSMTSNTNNQVLHFAIAKNGTAIASSTLQRKVGTGTDVGAATVAAFTSVTTNDYLTLQVKNTSWSASETVTCETANIVVLDMPK